ncbi:MAG: ABC transporter substrate-binding protein [Asticcacaulis sp.]
MSISRRMLLGQAGMAGAFSLLTGCGPSSPKDTPASDGNPQTGGTLIIGQAGEPLALSSAGSIDGGASAVSVKIFDGLFTMDFKGNLVPKLALSADLSPDGLVTRIKLRPDVKWHDGEAFTSADVAYSIGEVWRVYHPRSQTALSNLLRIETPSPLEVVLHFSQPVPYIFATLADGSSQVVPRHLYEGKDVLTNPHNVNPVGTGPFQFESWTRGQHLVLKRNPNYWDGPRPYLDKLIFRFIAAGAATVAALESGAIHYSGGGVPLSDIERLRQNPDLWVETEALGSSANFSGFGFNLNNPVLQDRRVRHAFAHAINRDFLVKNIWLGSGEVADSPIPPYSEWHAANLPQYGYDLKKAEALLDAAGLRRNADGIRLTLRNELMPPSGLYPRVSQYIRQDLAKIGIDLKLRSEALSGYLNRKFTTRDWDTDTYGTGSDFDPAIGIQRFYWSKSIKVGVPFTNPTHYASPEVDRLLEAAQVEIDYEKRKALYAQAQTVIQTDLPLIPIVFPHSHRLGVKRLSHNLTTRTDNLAHARFLS